MKTLMPSHSFQCVMKSGIPSPASSVLGQVLCFIILHPLFGYFAVLCPRCHATRQWKRKILYTHSRIVQKRTNMHDSLLIRTEMCDSLQYALRCLIPSDTYMDARFALIRIRMYDSFQYVHSCRNARLAPIRTFMHESFYYEHRGVEARQNLSRWHRLTFCTRRTQAANSTTGWNKGKFQTDRNNRQISTRILQRILGVFMTIFDSSTIFMYQENIAYQIAGVLSYINLKSKKQFQTFPYYKTVFKWEQFSKLVKL